jgi:Trypsin-like peptidase domain
MRKCVRRPQTNPAPPERVAVQTLLLAALLFHPCHSESQSPPPRPPSSSQSGGATAEMSPEDIFSRFASRVLVLICDLSADDLKQASGVLVSADGFIVTNAHVVEGCHSATATQISGASRRAYEAVLKYYDKKTDTAVLKIEGKGFESFGLLTRSVRVGERVYAIGNPKGLEQSISEGIVSGIREEDGALWIQHSAAIAPGSSGGALISSRGELLGINSWFVKESQGLNFAVPASTLASAYSGARDLQGSLRFPGSPPVAQTQAPPPASPHQDPSLFGPPSQSIPEPRPPAKARTNEPAPHGAGTDPAERPEDAVLRKARESSAAFRDYLPNYVCQEFITRYSSTSHIVSWQPLGAVSIEFVYENGREQYRNVSINGDPTKRGFEELPGSWSVLTDVFSPSTAADFRYRRESRSGGRPAMVYDFSVEREHSHWKIMVATQMVMPSYRGSVWIDKETMRVLRIEMQATGLSGAFPLDKVESATDYEFVRFADRLFLMPVHAETLSCERGTDNCERNTIDFRKYSYYSSKASTLPRPGQNSSNRAEQLVRLNVTVSDKFGRRITSLPQSAFTVLENGAPQQIRIFKLEEVPVSMRLIIDSSGTCGTSAGRRSLWRFPLSAI